MGKQPMERKLLIVDDDDSSRMLLSEFLEDFEYLITEASSYVSAVEIINSSTIDVAVLDMNLPDGTGTDLAKLLNEKSPETRILLLSGNDIDATQKACTKASARVDCHLSKPFSLQGIADWIDSL